ncbi:hypothetical protein K458DRAFT_208937, partial [Lentithecium fluviatile CBS 122367]
GSGLFLFNSNKVLANILKLPPPPVKLTILISNATMQPGYDALPTPATLKSGADLVRLLNIIEHVPKEPNDEASI